MQPGGGVGEDLAARGGDADHVLELGGEGAVAGHGGPAVVEHLHLRAAGIHHRLDGEEHAFLELGAFTGAAEMEDVGRGVEGAADAVAAEVADHGEALLLHVALDGVADVAERGAGLHHGDAAEQALVGHVHQQGGLPARLPGHVHAGGVAVPAVEDGGDVDVEDVALHQPPLAGDAMADDVVDGDAGALRVAAVAQRRRDGAVVEHEVVAELVERLGGGAGHHMGRDHVQAGGGQLAGLAHALEILRPMQRYPPRLAR